MQIPHIRIGVSHASSAGALNVLCVIRKAIPWIIVRVTLEIQGDSYCKPGVCDWMHLFLEPKVVPFN